MKFAAILVVIVLVIVVIGGYLILSAPHPPNPVQPSDSNSQLDAIENAVNNELKDKQMNTIEDAISNKLNSQPHPINGLCGTAAKVYDANATVYSGSFCTTGAHRFSSEAFPAAGSSASWDCVGANGGTTATCSATHQPAVAKVNGSCGTAAKAYASTATSFSGTFCSTGTQSPATVTFPSTGNSANWNCISSNGGTNAACTATVAAATQPVSGMDSIEQAIENSLGH